MKIKVSELVGRDLDYWVAKAENINPVFNSTGQIITDNHINFYVSRSWSMAGPIIQREQIALDPCVDGAWYAGMSIPTGGGDYEALEMRGETPLIAAMRCFVASRFGEEVEI